MNLSYLFVFTVIAHTQAPNQQFRVRAPYGDIPSDTLDSSSSSPVWSSTQLDPVYTSSTIHGAYGSSGVSTYGSNTGYAPISYFPTMPTKKQYKCIVQNAGSALQLYQSQLAQNDSTGFLANLSHTCNAPADAVEVTLASDQVFQHKFLAQKLGRNGDSNFGGLIRQLPVADQAAFIVVNKAGNAVKHIHNSNCTVHCSLQ